MSILVFGATGNVGCDVVHQLVAKSIPVNAAARDPAKAKACLPNDVNIVHADFSDAASIQRAAESTKAEKAFLYAHAAKPEVLSALKKAGVKHIVFLSSCWVGYPSPPNAIQKWHQVAEDDILSQKFDVHTFIRPDSFASNPLMWKFMFRKGEVNHAHPDFISSIIAPEDIATVAVEALTTNELDNKVVNVLGRDFLTPRQQIETISEVLGKPLKVQQISEEQQREESKGHMPEPIIDALFINAKWKEEHNGKVSYGTADKTVTGKMTFREYVEKHKADFDF